MWRGGMGLNHPPYAIHRRQFGDSSIDLLRAAVREPGLPAVDSDEPVTQRTLASRATDTVALHVRSAFLILGRTACTCTSRRIGHCESPPSYRVVRMWPPPL